MYVALNCSQQIEGVYLSPITVIAMFINTTEYFFTLSPKTSNHDESNEVAIKPNDQRLTFKHG